MQIGAAFNWKRALAAFLLAYVVIAILGTALSVVIAAAKHTPPAAQPLQNAAYLLSERFLPVLNLVVWVGASWLYFRNSPQPRITRVEALALGVLWLAVALPLDFVAFVVIKTPISLSPYAFYVGQFPWIYLIYIVVFLSPLCYMTLSRMFGKRLAW